MKVLIGPNFMALEQRLPELEREFPQVEFIYCGDQDQLLDAISDVDIFMGWLSKNLVLAAQNLKWVQSPSSGINYYLAIREFVESDILLTSARGTHGACLAESVLGMIFAFTRGIRDSILCQQQRVWAGGKLRSKLVELTDSVMGIVGFGAVGRALAVRTQAFGARILAVDVLSVDKPEWVSELWDLDRLDDLLRESDYVVVTVPSTPETRGMIGAEQIALMKENAMLVGISRGDIIDQGALAQALREDRLAAAALDVFSPEPLPDDSELWALDNMLITPHIAGGNQFEAQYILDIFRENLTRFLSGNLPLRNQIDKQRGF